LSQKLGENLSLALGRGSCAWFWFQIWGDRSHCATWWEQWFQTFGVGPGLAPLSNMSDSLNSDSRP